MLSLRGKEKSPSGLWEGLQMTLLTLLRVPNWFPMSEEPWISLSAVWPAFYWPNRLANHCLQLNPSWCSKVNLFSAHKIWPPTVCERIALVYAVILGPNGLFWRAEAAPGAGEVTHSWNESSTMLCFPPRHQAPTRLPCLYSASFLLWCPAQSGSRWTRCFSSSTLLWFVDKVISALDNDSVRPFLFQLEKIRVQLISNFKRSAGLAILGAQTEGLLMAPEQKQYSKARSFIWQILTGKSRCFQWNWEGGWLEGQWVKSQGGGKVAGTRTMNSMTRWAWVPVPVHQLLILTPGTRAWSWLSLSFLVIKKR